MPLPNTFIAGDVARSADVNENFAYIMSILGQLSTPGRVKTTTEFLMGARANALFTGTHDSGPTDLRFFQLGWNADWNLSNGRWRFARFISGLAAGAIRIGEGYFSVILTSDQSTSLNSVMELAFKLKATSTGGRGYLPNGWTFQNYDGTARSLSDYRLMYTPLENAPAIYSGNSLSATTVIKTAKNFGVPTTAKAISITVDALLESGSSGRIKFLQHRASPSNRYGFTLWGPASGRACGQGIVPLGEGTRLGQFRVERTAAFNNVDAYIVGYWE